MDTTLIVTSWPKPERISYLLATIKSLDGIDAARRVLSCESQDVSRGMRSEVNGIKGWEIRWRKAPANLGLHLDELFSEAKSNVLYVQDDTPLIAPFVPAQASEEMPYIRFWCEMEGEGMVRVPNGKDMYSDRPFIMHPSFYARFGPYGPGEGKGRSHEELFDARVVASDCPVYAMLPSAFGHIGMESVFVPGKVWRKEKLTC